MDFGQIALLIAVAAGAGLLAKLAKQPLLVGYLVAGVVLSYFGVIKDPASTASLGKIGVALLLFMVGLEMNLKEIPTIGKVALLTGLSQIVFTFIVGFTLSNLLGFGLLPSAYIAIALTFSSTIIIVKLLSEKGDLQSLYGKIAIGFLLVQDFSLQGLFLFLPMEFLICQACKLPCCFLH